MRITHKRNYKKGGKIMDLIMGMNSGSSFDGIDVILAETEMAEDGFPKGTAFYLWRIL